MIDKDIEDFIRESNLIEGIKRDPTEAEITEMRRFLYLTTVTEGELLRFISIYQKDAKLRKHTGMDVQIGMRTPIAGGPLVSMLLTELLYDMYTEEVTPYEAHVRYEILHPFTDCNGRSGRALWLWRMTRHNEEVPKGFLHTWYYQSLDSAWK